MDRRALFPDWRAEWVLYEDDDIIAVDKPPGVPCMDDDGAPARLSRWLAERDGLSAPAYLGIHQRLDRETSGVLVYAKRREANERLARAFRGGEVDKTYLAIVTGWPRGAKRTFRGRLEKAKDGRMHVGRRGKLAITHARELSRDGDRTLLEVRTETGRTHQIRAQLAHAGSPIVGDPVYGGAPAHRLMLHAHGVDLGTGELLTAPATFERPRRLLLPAQIDRRYGLRGEGAFRLLNGEGDGVPGVAADVYGDFLVLHLYDEGLPAEALFDEAEALGFDGVYLKVRPRQANVVAETRRPDLAPREPVRGRAAPFEMTVHENGMPFVVRLGDGLSTGIFLDQRENRRRVRELAAGKSVLNLFAYTCAFTVAAALGGARRTVSVDAAAPALAWGERQVRALGTGGEHAFVRDDVFAVLRRLARGGERFDLVIADPPTYSTTKKSRWTSGRDWVDLAASALAVVAPGGRLLASSNDRRMSSRTLRRHLHEAMRRSGREAAQMKDLPAPVDFPVQAGTEPHLKSVLVTLSRR